jgi:hypothetical protein
VAIYGAELLARSASKFRRNQILRAKIKAEVCDKISRRLCTIRSQVFEHASIVHERAFGARTIKIRQNERKNPKKHGKQAKFKGVHFAISRGSKLAFAIHSACFNNPPRLKKRRLGSVSLRRVYKFHNLTALLSTA